MSVGVLSTLGKRDLRAGKCEKGKLVEMYNIGVKISALLLHSR